MNATNSITFNDVLIPLRGEKRRIKDLESVLRFDQAERVIHRNNLHTHMLRVSYLSYDLAQRLHERYDLHVDPIRAQRLAVYHDDPEVITGDIPTPIKYAMKPHERLALRTAEAEAVRKLATRYFGVNPWNRKRQQYLEYQKDMTKKESPEARVVNIADKIEGLCETIHEIRCGNETFDLILNNYRNFFDSFITNEPLFDFVNGDSAYRITLDTIPTPKEAHGLQKIKIDIFQKDQTKFWQQVFAPELPNFYKQWLLVSVEKFKTQALFTGWKSILGDAKPSVEIQEHFHK
ncbi:MAG: HD domain-containing protein [Candidatus Levybacteria bacterium]|nr:HD domain-containing protein [Candidatus Levybacteria bacterium]